MLASRPRTVAGAIEGGRDRQAVRQGLMFDSLTIARQLTEAGIERARPTCWRMPSAKQPSTVST